MTRSRAQQNRGLGARVAGGSPRAEWARSSWDIVAPAGPCCVCTGQVVEVRLGAGALSRGGCSPRRRTEALWSATKALLPFRGRGEPWLGAPSYAHWQEDDVDSTGAR